MGIRDETFDIRCPKLEDITDDLLGIANRNMNIPTPSPAHMSLSIRRFQLDQYISEIKLLFYHLPKELRPLVWPGDLKGLQARIKLDLDAWLTETSQILPPAEWEGDTLCFQHENSSWRPYTTQQSHSCFNPPRSFVRHHKALSSNVIRVAVGKYVYTIISAQRTRSITAGEIFMGSSLRVRLWSIVSGPVQLFRL